MIMKNLTWRTVCLARYYIDSSLPLKHLQGKDGLAQRKSRSLNGIGQDIVTWSLECHLVSI